MSLLLKKTFDICFALVLLTLFSPIFLVLCPLIAIKMGTPILFRQERPGYRGKLFKIFKFRTMRDGPEEDHLRVTKFGATLRSLSLDELPQLINVLKGELSLVGPRPLLTEYLPLYNDRQKKRHEMPPGITGWAQVNGRNAISWEEKFEFDVWYVENWSLWLDVKILFLTFFKVLNRKGVNSSAQVTMEKFKGSQK